jgi:hypothetical protein
MLGSRTTLFDGMNWLPDGTSGFMGCCEWLLTDQGCGNIASSMRSISCKKFFVGLLDL